MRKRYIYFLLINFFLTSGILWGQLLIENFSYSVGQLTDLNGGANVSGGNWTNFSGTSNPLQVISGSLSYTGYPSSGIDNKVAMVNGTAEDAYTSFTSVTSEKVYASFLVNITSTTSMTSNSSTTGDFFVAFLSSTNTTLFAARVSVKVGSVAGTYNFGLLATATNSETLFKTTDYTTGVTHLIAISYEIIAGSANDVLKMWIDPDLSGSQPVADLTQTSAADLADISRFVLRQGASAVNAEVDGIRVATSWSLAPLPVELSSFAAYLQYNAVNLKWQTKTEVNNYGFEIERASAWPTPIQTWQKIGFVNGSGNSNSPKDYSFTDKSVKSGKFIYRLKQIDTDGKFEYSKIVEVDLGLPINYSLEQNYPNPFNPSTVISWQSPVGSQQVIKLFDVLGNEVATLIDEWKEAGNHSLKFDASGLSSGVYYYKLTTDNFSSTKKMILTK